MNPDTHAARMPHHAARMLRHKSTLLDSQGRIDRTQTQRLDTTCDEARSPGDIGDIHELYTPVALHVWPQDSAPSTPYQLIRTRGHASGKLPHAPTRVRHVVSAARIEDVFNG